MQKQSMRGSKTLWWMAFPSLPSLCSSLVGQRDEGGSSPALLNPFLPSLSLSLTHTHTQQRQITHCSISSTNTSPRMTNLSSKWLFYFSLPQLLLVRVVPGKDSCEDEGECSTTTSCIIHYFIFTVSHPTAFYMRPSGVKFYPTFMLPSMFVCGSFSLLMCQSAAASR